MFLSLSTDWLEHLSRAGDWAWRWDIMSHWQGIHSKTISPPKKRKKKNGKKRLNNLENRIRQASMFLFFAPFSVQKIWSAHTHWVKEKKKTDSTLAMIMIMILINHYFGLCIWRKACACSIFPHFPVLFMLNFQRIFVWFIQVFWILWWR